MEPHPNEKVLENWIQEQLVEPPGERLRIELTWLRGVELGSIQVERFDPITKILHANRVAINLTGPRLRAEATAQMLSWLDDYGITLDGDEPFPSPLRE